MMRHHIINKLAHNLLLPFILIILAFLITLNTSIDWNWLKEVALATYYSVLQTIVSWGLFVVLFYVIMQLMTQVVSRYWRMPENYGMIMTLFLIVLLLINAFPILWYLFLFNESFDLWHSPTMLFVVKVSTLMFANGMLYYIFSNGVFELINETDALYIVSAEYKNTTVADYAGEKLTWLMWSESSTIFYYLFSFTLFTDLFLDYMNLEESKMGIVGKLFIIIIQPEGWTMHAVVGLFCMLAIILPLRLFVCQLPLWLWEKHHLVET